VTQDKRHPDESQRAMVAARAKPMFEAEARKNQGARSDLSPNLGKGSAQAEVIGSRSGTTVDKMVAVFGGSGTAPRSVPAGSRPSRLPTLRTVPMARNRHITGWLGSHPVGEEREPLAIETERTLGAAFVYKVFADSPQQSEHARG
jgi:hypothetical protein